MEPRRPVIRPVLSTAAVLLLLAGCAEKMDAPAVEAAAVAFLRESGGPPGRGAVEEVKDGYARVRVTPTGGDADPAWVFVQREDGRWQGILYGTAFGPEDYDELGIPSSLRIR